MTSGGCTQWLAHLGRYCGDTPTRRYIQGWRCAGCAPGPDPEPLVATGPARRPPGHGRGLDGPPCPERAVGVQVPVVDGPVRQRMCICCGRVTARLDGDGLAWCGGTMPERYQPRRHLSCAG